MSDSESDEDDLDSYRERMRDVKKSSGRGPVDMEQVQARARRTQEKTNAALANSLRIAHETQAIGNATLEDLHRQGETLQNATKRLDTIENDLSYSQKVIKVMRSPFGWLTGGKIKEKEPKAAAEAEEIGTKSKSKAEDDTEAEGMRGRLRGQASGGASSSSSGRRAGGNSNWVYDQDGDDDEDEDGDDPDKAWVAEMRKDFKAQDDTLDEISGIMGNLKMQGNLMSEELERQKSVLDTLDTKVEKDQAMLTDVNKKVGKMLGKRDKPKKKKSSAK